MFLINFAFCRQLLCPTVCVCLCVCVRNSNKIKYICRRSCANHPLLRLWLNCYDCSQLCLPKHFKSAKKCSPLPPPSSLPCLPHSNLNRGRANRDCELPQNRKDYTTTLGFLLLWLLTKTFSCHASGQLARINQTDLLKRSEHFIH